MPLGDELVAQQAGRGVNQAAFHAGVGSHKLAFALKRHALRRGEVNRHRLEGLTRKTAGKVLTPAHGDGGRHHLHRQGLAVRWQRRL